MREFFGLILFILLLSLWSLVFADGKIKSQTVSSNNTIVIEKSINASEKM